MPEPAEHYCTLFDSAFLPFGLCLHESLMAYSRSAHLWILCLDESVERQLGALTLENATLLPLREIESDRLLAVKPTRRRVEYCWTLTPFLIEAVLHRAVGATRVTYLDADLYFFDEPAALLDELQRAGKDVLITEHAYAPEYDQTLTSGRFCVQFMTFARTDRAQQVLRWWQDRCIEWCFARLEDGKFGDQKYLEAWPALFGDTIHVSALTTRTLAPWNVRHFAASGELRPIFFHFHGLRRFGRTHLRLYSGYRVGRSARFLYQRYLASFRRAVSLLDDAGVVLPAAERPPLRQWLLTIRQILIRRSALVRL